MSGNNGGGAKGAGPAQPNVQANVKPRSIVLDVTEALAIVDEIYASAMDDGWSRPVERLAEGFRSHGGAFFAQNPDSGEVPVVEFARFDPDAVASYVEHYAAINPWVEAERNMPSGSAVLGEQLVDDESFLESAFYNEWLAPQSLRHSLGSVVLRDERLLSKMTLLRLERLGPYEINDLEVFHGFVRHFGRALELRDQLADARRRERVQMDVLERLAVGVALLRSDGGVSAMNRQLRELVEADDGLRVSKGRLVPARQAERRGLEKAVAAALDTAAGNGLTPGDSLPIPRPSGRRALVVTVVPLPGSAAIWFDHERPPAAAVFVGDPEGATEPDPERLSATFGLTPGEARLAVCVARGLSLQEAATELSIAPETARTVIKRVFQKTDVHSQAQLTQLVLAGFGATRLDGS